MSKSKSVTEIVKAEQPTALALPAHRELTPSIWRMISEIAPAMASSHLMGVTNAAQASAIMLKGYELGLSITASFELIHVISGKPALSPRGAMALLLSNPLVEDIKITRITEGDIFIGYKCDMKRVGGFEYTASFSLEDAMRANLVKPDSGWAKYPENMCLWRAVGFAADVVFPDVTAGMTTLDESPRAIRISLTEGGDVIIEAQTAPVTVNPLSELLSMYGAEKIMEASGGAIPQTDEEIEAVKAKLAAQ